MEPDDDDVPLILTWDDANSGLLSEDAERGDESESPLSSLPPPPHAPSCVELLVTVEDLDCGASELCSCNRSST